ncbi:MULTISPECIES: phage antirepressor KilAC domain-containing protein [Acinetobacter]|uniref:phage antirepressor KilAC domain-containing protein n=1 Tax=Acinetobacter TaxID=469 RepID=UPI001F4A6253|nr:MULTISPECIES: phage regulatory protein/antirepressor Ant [Acinetobacter]MCH7379349.1 phage regulatory protein/antirepressor Ant [Acinetobacter higginsii]
MNKLVIAENLSNAIKTMSTREIAELTGKEHFNVKRDCEVMFRDLGIDALKFEGIYFDSMNRPQTEYQLDKELTMTLVTGYSIVLRNGVIKRWQELENLVKQPQELSKLEILQLAIESEKQKVALEQQVSVLEPKALALDAIADTSNTYTIRECATTLKIREKELVNLIIDKGWCYRDASSRLRPYAQKVQQGVFINRASPVITHPVTQEEKVYLHMHVTAYGLTRLTALVNRHRGG